MKMGKETKSPLVKIYLVGYNSILTIGWTFILYNTIQNSNDFEDGTLWESVELQLKLFQTAAVMEVVHAIIGIVPSNVFLTFFQVLSRVFAVWGVLHLSPPSQHSIGLLFLLYAWSVTEIIRYGYYALNLIGFAFLIQWLRYTLFIVLYPIGVTGELICIYKALSFVEEKEIATIRLPNSYNFAFDYKIFLIGTMLSYIPIFPQLYFHMFAQRRKMIGNVSSSTSKSKTT